MASAVDILGLRKRLEAARVFERRPVATWMKFVFLLSVFAALTIVPLLTVTWLYWVLMPIAALFLTAAVMIGHEGGHKALSDGSFQNNLVLYISFPFIGGQSAQYWKNKHNIKHHTQPNIEGVDDDIDIWPMASTRQQHEASGPFRKFLQRKLQMYLFWPLSSLLPLSMRYSSIAYLVRAIRAGKRGPEIWLDVAALALHYFAWLVLPSLVFGFSPLLTLGAYFAFWCFMGLYLTAIFAPAHMGLPIYRSHDDAWRLQFEVTRNLDMPAWLRFFFIGLDHQVEHHLFMRMPHQNMLKAVPIVRQWAAEQGVRYQEINFWKGLVEVTRYVRDAWKNEAPEVVLHADEPVGSKRAA